MAVLDRQMRTYVIKRVALMVPTLVAVTFLVFLLCQFVPGGPIDQIRMQLSGAGESGEVMSGSRGGSESALSESDLAKLKEYYGFDKPIHIRYWYYLSNLATLDLGRSFRYSMPVWDLIELRFPISIFYGLITTILTYAVCIPLGIVKAIKHQTFIDNSTSILIFLGFAIPNFALGAVLITFLSARFDLFPLGGFNSPSQEFEEMTLVGKGLDIAHHAVLPLICYMIGSFAIMTMLMKNSLMENMGADYVKTALANGLPWRRAILGHAVRNSLIPLATTFGQNISLLIAGSLLIEKVFSIQGLGLLSFDAIISRDYPVVMGITVIGSLLLLVGNLLSDLCVAAVDPRVRFK